MTTYLSTEQYEPEFKSNDYWARLARGFAPERLAGLTKTFATVGSSWVRIGSYSFRRVVSITGETWLQARVGFGRYLYSIDVTEEQAFCLSAGFGHFTSRSAGRGRRYDVQLVAGGRA